MTNTVTIQTFKFSELSELSKQVAINDYRNSNYPDDYLYEEIKESCTAVAELFNFNFGREYSDIRTGHIDSSILELSGVRLYKYILNNFWNDLFKRKYLGCIGDNKVIKHRMSKTSFYDVTKGARVSSSNFIYSNISYNNQCTLTGVCYDNDILEPIYEFLKKPCKHTNFEGLLNYIGNAIDKVFRNTEEYTNSDSYITDVLNSLDTEYTITGKTFNY